MIATQQLEAELILIVDGTAPPPALEAWALVRYRDDARRQLSACLFASKPEAEAARDPDEVLVSVRVTVERVYRR